MRILVVSDIHANPVALNAIRDEFDVCLFLGDLVDYGVDPNPCIEWIKQNADYCVRGNHDHGAAHLVYVQGLLGFRYLTGVSRPISCELISPENRRFLASFPTSKLLTIDGKKIFLVHATPRDPFDEYGPPDVEFWRKRLEGLDVDYLCVGHTHVQYALHVGGTIVLNPGSVGLPRDGDPRAAYAIITPEGPILKRVEYPIEEAIAAIENSKLPDLAKLMMTEVYRTGRLERKPAYGFTSQNGDSKFGLSRSADGAVVQAQT